MDIHHFAFVFGLMGNIISFLVLLAPAPTFYQIYKKKSTEGFHSLPYVVSLLSCMIWIYYALLTKNTGLLLITINSFGCVLESIYISIFLFYASKKLRISTIKLVLLLNVFGYGSMLLSTLYLVHERSKRINIVGWVSLVFNISVFAAPLSSMRRVIKTKSVEFMPFNLSMCLTLNAVMWFFYGLSLKDYYIALPNTIGFLFGIVQMVLYLMYKSSQSLVMEDPVKVQNHQSDHIIEVMKLSSDNKNPLVIKDPVKIQNHQSDHIIQVLKLSSDDKSPLVMEDPVKDQNHQSDHSIEVVKLSSDNKNKVVTQDVESNKSQENTGDNGNV